MGVGLCMAPIVESVLERVQETGPVSVSRDIRTGKYIAYDCKYRTMVEIAPTTLRWIRSAAKDISQTRQATTLASRRSQHTGVIDWCIVFDGNVYVRLCMKGQKHVWVDYANCCCEA